MLFVEFRANTLVTSITRVRWFNSPDERADIEWRLRVLPFRILHRDRGSRYTTNREEISCRAQNTAIQEMNCDRRISRGSRRVPGRFVVKSKANDIATCSMQMDFLVNRMNTSLSGGYFYVRFFCTCWRDISGHVTRETVTQEDIRKFIARKKTEVTRFLSKLIDNQLSRQVVNMQNKTDIILLKRRYFSFFFSRIYINEVLTAQVSIAISRALILFRSANTHVTLSTRSVVIKRQIT